MKATGIVRRLDELGRIVIPKELRRTLHLQEGDSLEIYTRDEQEIILKRYSSLSELSGLAEDYCSVLARCIFSHVIICNTQQVLAASETQKEFINAPIGLPIQHILHNRRVYIAGNQEPKIQEPLFIRSGLEQPRLRLAVPITLAARVEGCILLLSVALPGQGIAVTVTETERKCVVLTAELLAKQLGK